MKYFLIIFFISLSYRFHCQSIAGEKITYLGHSYKIDSLLIDLSKHWNSSYPKDSCLAMEIEKNNAATFLDFGPDGKQDVNVFLATAHFKKRCIGFFRFKGYIVFVISSKKNTGLFTQTKTKKSFNYLDFSSKPIIIRPLDLSIGSHYRYINGRIIFAY